jgi:hypothetical protein
MLSAAAAPAPSAMHRIAVKASSRRQRRRRDQEAAQAGEDDERHHPGLVSARKSRQSATGASVEIAALFILQTFPDLSFDTRLRQAQPLLRLSG